MPWTDPAAHVFTTGEVVTAATLNTIQNNLLYLKGDVAWTAVAFNANWSDFGLGYTPCSYKRVGDFVEMRGLAKVSAGAGAALFTLAAGYRPLYGVAFVVDVGPTPAGELKIATTGVVSITTVPAAGNWVQLDGLRFPVV